MNPTPGPWHRAGHRTIAAGTGPNAVTICEIFSGGVGIEQADQNEALIELAPEMLTILRQITAEIDKGAVSLPYPTWGKLIEVLSKAPRGAGS
ncbi:hypothetical protein [Zoogloea sp. LCSB751]|uniref:hypothetical protein n=1 Tax=Zoogloea sp. LCSB751 TaxID=1965277 RepID=UPI0009A4853C|nr:hypothetical protein [Zoogloea sp. LCSB751]